MLTALQVSLRAAVDTAIQTYQDFAVKFGQSCARLLGESGILETIPSSCFWG